MGFPTASNVFVPEAQKSLQVDFSRNESRFKINQYVKMVQTDKKSGYWIKHDPDAEARLVKPDGSDKLFNDGAYANVNFRKGHSFVQYTTQRYADAFIVGDQTEKQAYWSVIADHSKSAARNLMNLRTQLVLNALTASGNWPSGHDISATSAGGGKWDVGTTGANSYFRKGLSAGIRILEKATNAAIDPSEMILLLNSEAAMKLGLSPEIQDYLKGSPFSLPTLEARNFGYFLPDVLGGVKIVVENAVKNTAQEGVARAESYIADSDQAWLICRPGGLVGDSDMNTMSTITMPFFEEMNVAAEHNNLHRLTEGLVSDDYAVIINGYLGVRFTDILT